MLTEPVAFEAVARFLAKVVQEKTREKETK
jgi:hypothetical protein